MCSPRHLQARRAANPHHCCTGSRRGPNRSTVMRTSTTDVSTFVSTTYSPIRLAGATASEAGVTLPDGTWLAIHQLDERSTARFTRFVEALAPEDRHRRFFAMLPVVKEWFARQLCDVDQV